MRQITIALYSCFFLSAALAQNTTREFRITKEWKADASTQFELSAKYQRFTVEVWDKDVVRIDFILSTDDTHITEDNFRDALKITDDRNGNRLTVNTVMNDLSNNSIWDWLFSSKKNKSRFKLHNVLHLPRNLSSLDFTLNYSDLQTGDLNVRTKITANYSTLNISRNTSKTTLSATYTDVQLGNMAYLKINSSYSDFILNNIDTLYVGSNYGDIKANSCAFIQSMTLNYGNFTTQKAGTAKITSTYSDIKLNSLEKELNTVLNYSDLQVNDISKDFSGITVSSTYSDSKLKINAGNPVNLAINDVNGDIDMKNPQVTVTKKTETGNTTVMTARTRTATDASPTIRINSSNSDVIIY